MDAYNQGYEAAYENLTTRDNPHPENSDAYIAWLTGWQSAVKAIREWREVNC